MNLIAYAIYAVLLVTVILRIGHLCYRHGRVYTDAFFPKDAEFSKSINDMLLVAYYLINLGYGVTVVATWEDVQNIIGVVQSVTSHFSMILLILAVLHYSNLFIIKLIYQFKFK